jgi:hypothetical protein
MDPQRFKEVTETMRPAFGEGARSIALGQADRFYIGVLHQGDFACRTLIANTIEGDDTVAVYDGVLRQSGNIPNNPRIAIKFNNQPIVSTLSAEDTARLGELAAAASGEDIVFPAQRGFRSTYPGPQDPDLFRGAPLEPFPSE